MYSSVTCISYGILSFSITDIPWEKKGIWCLFIWMCSFKDQKMKILVFIFVILRVYINTFPLWWNNLNNFHVQLYSTIVSHIYMLKQRNNLTNTHMLYYYNSFRWFQDFWGEICSVVFYGYILYDFPFFKLFKMWWKL